MPIISSFSNQFKPIGGNLVVINDLILPPSNDFTYVLIPNNDLTFTLIPTNDLNYIEIPNNDILYGFIPDNDINYVTIPNNDVAYTLIPNTDLTYTLIPNNDIEYNVLKPGNSFYGQIILGEDSVEGTCNCAEWECPRFYVTGDGPTFCDSNIFVTNGDGFNLNGWGTIVHNGFYKTVNMDGTNIATYRTDCGSCPTTPTPTPTETPTPTPTPIPYNKIVDLNINSLASYSGSGTTVTDILGNTNAYVTNLPIYQNDGCSSSIALNGNDQFIITTTSIQSFYDSTDTSLFLWVYLTDNGVILSEQGGGGLNFNWHDSQIELVNGTLKFSVWPYNGVITSSISTPLNNWYHIGFVQNNTTLTAYVNGQSAGSSTVVRQVPYENGHGLYYAIGAPDSTNLGDGSYSALKFGRLEIWDGAISSSDVLQNYNNSVTTWICPTPTPTPTITPTPTPTPATSSPYSYTIQARAIDGSNNKYGWVIQQDACQGGEFNVTIYSNSSTFVDGMNFYSDTNVGSINDIVTYMEYYYYYPLENKTFRLLNGNIVGEVASCPTPTPTPTSTSTPTPTPTPTATSTPTPTPTATSTPTPTPTLEPLNFTISGICQNDGSIRLSDFVGSASNNYQYTGGIHTTENSALNATFWGSIVGGNIGVVTIGSSGTYWVAVRETETPSNIIAKSVTINCVETSGLVLHYDPSLTTSYPGTGTTINDLTGQGRTGTMSNITFTSPYLTFNGTSSQISVPDSIGLEPQSGDWTVEVWVNQTVGGNDVVLGKFNAGGLASNVGYSVRTTGSSFYAQYGSGSGSGATMYSNSTTHNGTVNTWYQLVYVFTNIAANTFETFVNGTSIGSVNHSLSSILNTSTNLYIGSYNNGEYAQWFDGKIGIVRMYNKVLTASEILGNYNTDKSKYGL